MKSNLVPLQAKNQFEIDKKSHLELVSEKNANFMEIASCLLKHFKDRIIQSHQNNIVFGLLWWPKPKHKDDNDVEETFT